MLELESAAIDVRDELEALQQSHAQLQSEFETQQVSLTAVQATAEPSAGSLSVSSGAAAAMQQQQSVGGPASPSTLDG